MRKKRTSLVLPGNRRFLILLLVFLPLTACGRFTAQKELSRTQFFAEVLKREDQRWIGNDKFFENNLLSGSFPEASKWSAVALGRIGNPETLPLLYSALHSGDASVRAASAFAIGEIEDREQLDERYLAPDPRATREIIALLNDASISVGMRAVEALGKIGSRPEAAEIVHRLESFSYQGTPYERAYLAISIAALAKLDNPVAVPVLERFAGHDDPEIRWRALNALARLQSKASAPLFVKNLQNPNAEVQASAACGMTYVADASQADLLFPLLAPRQEDRGIANHLPVRICALLSLGFLRNPAAVPAIQAAISAEPVDENHPDQQSFVIQAAAALGNIRAKNSEAVLLPLLKLPGPVADDAVIAIAAILRGNPESFFELAESYHSLGKIREPAWANAMSELGGPDAVEELNRMLERAKESHAPQEHEILPAVLYALAKTGTPVSQDIWNLLLRRRDCAVLATAVDIYQILPRAKAPWAPAVEAFTTCNSSSNVQARLEILSGLRPWIREKGVQQLLWTGLKDPDRFVREASRTLLRGAGITDSPSDAGAEKGTLTDPISRALATTRKNSTIAQLETSRGKLEIELFREDAPVTVMKFVLTANRGGYNGMKLTRILPFRIEGRIPRTSPVAGRTINREINMRPFERGSIGMALAANNSDSGGFFITLAPQPDLDGVHTCFGRVISGMQIADRIGPDDRIIRIFIKETVSFQDYQRY